jgi:CMP-N,N'-diacetyllegionaminic acid synthase
MSHPCQPLVALIPAREGSKRLPGKNTKRLAGRPLLRYTVAAAQQSGVFARIVVCSDDPVVWQLAYQWGVEWFERAPVPDGQPDIVWIREVLTQLKPRPMAFAILRPTSPFRTAETIRRAYQVFTLPDQTADSIRAVEPAKQSPYKMWTQSGPAQPIKPLLDGGVDGVPYHSSPTQAAPVVYVQNSSLELSWTSNVEGYGTITGRKVAPFFTRGLEGFAIDTEADWREAEYLARTRPDALPAVDVAGVSPAPAAQ